jgi:Bacterial SH3 domain
LLLVFPVQLNAEEFTGGSAAELEVATNLLRGPQENAEVIGRLPKGTIMTLLGDIKEHWVKIEVELLDGVEQGWVEEKSIKLSSVDENSEFSKNKKKLSKKGKKKSLPADEMVLLRRDSVFNYGIYAGANYGFLTSIYASSAYQGMGLQGGGFLSYFVTRDILLGAEIGLTQLQGTQSVLDPQTQAALSGTARLLDVAAVLEYLYQSFRFFGGIQYSLGIGLADFPPNQPPAPSDVSSVWFRFGMGYSVPLSDVVNLVAKGFYGYGINRSTIGFQNFGLSAYLEFRG